MAERAFAFAASSSRLLGAALVSSDRRRRVETAATSSTAARKAGSFAFEGLLKPLIFLTYWSEAARTSSSVTGGSKLNSILIFRHIPRPQFMESPTTVILNCERIQHAGVRPLPTHRMQDPS